MQSSQVLKPAFPPSLNGFPVAMLWKLLIDSIDQANDGVDWLRSMEPGYLKSMFAGLMFVFSTYEIPTTVEYLVQLHDTAVKYTTVKRSVMTNRGMEDVVDPFPIGLRRNNGTEFGLVPNDSLNPTTRCIIGRNCTKAGIKELLEKIAASDTPYTIRDEQGEHIFNRQSIPSPVTEDFTEKVWAIINERPCTLSLRAPKNGELRARIQLILDHYYRVIKVAKNSDDKLYAIATCVHDLEIEHAFHDGNCRTFAILFLHKLLFEQGLPPCNLICRDRFDAFSSEELCLEIKAGIAMLQRQVNRSFVFEYSRTIADLFANEICSNKQFANVDASERDSVRIQVRDILTTLFQEGLLCQGLPEVLQIVKKKLEDALCTQTMFPFGFISRVFFSAPTISLTAVRVDMEMKGAVRLQDR